ncbi:hypothetical protein [Nitratireductor sp. XY-223]|uniref:hypothetical protein n=1 Tax=Nitratireductor sp. XY-223 TaxID=2561926 RepID=UPI0010AAE150|nr:hypothetical protein [Nitratireductor sp. XY-223]
MDDAVRPAVPRQRQTAPQVEVPAEAFGRAATGAPPHMNLFSKTQPRKRRVQQRPVAGFAALVALLCAVGFWLAGGHALFAGASADRGLTLSRISVDPLRVQDESYFVLHGVISNESSDARTVPLLAIESAGAPEGQVPLYARAGKQQLAAGESTRFTVRVPSAIRDYEQLTVSLAGAGTAR